MNGVRFGLSSIGVLVVASSVACQSYRPLPPPAGASFAAHAVARGFMVDTMRGDAATPVVDAHLLHLHDEPSLVVEGGSKRGEGIWLQGPGTAVVRASESPRAPVVGRVTPVWVDDAIELRIDPTEGVPLRTGPFERLRVELGPPVITRRTDREDDLDGAYRAVLRDPDGTRVGWLEVSLGGEQPILAMYQGVLPPSVDTGLAVASIAALREEMLWIAAHTRDAMPGMVDRP